MAEQIPLQLAGSPQAFRTSAAIDEYSAYLLFPVEKQLIAKHCRPGDRILDRLHTLYTSADFVIRQTESTGLKFLETMWLKMIGNDRVDKYFSPYLYYIFTKRGNQPPAR